MKYTKTLLVPLIVASLLSVSIEPKRSHAIFGFGDIVFDPASLGQAIEDFAMQGSQLAEQTIMASNSISMNLKEFVLDPLAFYGGRQLLSSMVNQTTRWVNSGFQGGAKPFFLSNPDKFFLGVANNQVNTFIYKTTGISNIYNKNVILNTIMRQRNNYVRKMTYSLSGTIAQQACDYKRAQNANADGTNGGVPLDIFTPTEPPVLDPGTVVYNTGVFKVGDLFVAPALAQTTSNPFTGAVTSTVTGALGNTVRTFGNAAVQGKDPCAQLSKMQGLNTRLAAAQARKAPNSELVPIVNELNAVQLEEREKFNQDFSYGGWDAWLDLIQPKNNESGADTLADQEKLDEVANAKDIQSDNLNRGGGLLTDRYCALRDENAVDENGDYYDDDTSCLQWEQTTPGSAVRDQMTGALKSAAFDIPTDEISELITALAMSLVTNLTSPTGMFRGSSSATTNYTNAEMPSGIRDQMSDTINNTNDSSAYGIDVQRAYLAELVQFRDFYQNIITSSTELTTCQNRLISQRTSMGGNAVVSATTISTDNYPESCWDGGCSGGVTWNFAPPTSFIGTSRTELASYNAKVSDFESKISTLESLLAASAAATTDAEIQTASQNYANFVQTAGLKNRGDVDLLKLNFEKLTTNYNNSRTPLGKSVQDLNAGVTSCSTAQVVIADYTGGGGY